MTDTDPSKNRHMVPFAGKWMSLRGIGTPRDIGRWYKASFLGTVSCIILYTVYGLFFIRHHAFTISREMGLLMRFKMTPIIGPDDPYLHGFLHQLGSALFFGLTLGVLNAIVCMGLSLLPWGSGRLGRRDLSLLILGCIACTFFGFSKELPLLSVIFGILCPIVFTVSWVRVVRKGTGEQVRTPRWVVLTAILYAPFLLLIFMKPSFLMLRDSMLDMPVTDTLSDFYYNHTLLAADVIKPPAARTQNVIAVSEGIERIGEMPHGTLWIRSHDPCSMKGASMVVSRVDTLCTSIVLHDGLPANENGRIFTEYSKVLDRNKYMRNGIGFFLFSGPLIIVLILLISWLGLGLEKLSRRSMVAVSLFVFVYMALFIPAWHTTYLGIELRSHPERIREYMNSGEEKKRYLVASTYPGAVSAEDLERMIREPSMRIRVNALIEAGNRRDPSFMALMEDALKDTQLNVRTKACWALGRIGSERAFLFLEKIVRNDPSWYVRVYAYSALGKIRPEAKVVSADF
jgi:hypothetical protein